MKIFFFLQILIETHNPWQDVPSRALKELFSILAEAQFAIVHPLEGFSTNLSRGKEVRYE